MRVSGNPTALTAVARAHSEPARREGQCTTAALAAQQVRPATIQPHARVVKQVDTRDLKFLERKLIPVRVRSRAPGDSERFSSALLWLDRAIDRDEPHLRQGLRIDLDGCPDFLVICSRSLTRSQRA